MEAPQLVDQDLLTVKLQELDRYLAQMKNHQGVTPERLEEDLAFLNDLLAFLTLSSG